MKKLTVTMRTTLDGFIADTKNDLSWVLMDKEMEAYEIKVASNADTLLLGKTTYQDWADYWPNVPNNPKADEFEKTIAPLFNAAKKIVVSQSLEQAHWKDTTILRDVVPEEIKRLKNGSEKGILIYGSANLIQQLTKLSLIDEYQLLVHPVTLGDGKPLFKDRVDLNLVNTRPFQSGVMLLTYQPVPKE